MRYSRVRRENLVCNLARHLGYGVVGVDPVRAEEARVPLGQYRQSRGGFYAEGRQPRAGKFLVIDEWSPGDGWMRYRLDVVSQEGSGEDHFGRSSGSTAAGFDGWLQGALAALEELSHQKQIKREKRANMRQVARRMETVMNPRQVVA